jgi:hypothetical protein
MHQSRLDMFGAPFATFFLVLLCSHSAETISYDDLNTPKTVCNQQLVEAEAENNFLS